MRSAPQPHALAASHSLAHRLLPLLLSLPRRAPAPAEKFCTLRQQAEKETNDEPYLALADFIAPKATGLRDYIGGFAVAIFGGAEQYARYLCVLAWDA